jgi:hypothetical protein
VTLVASPQPLRLHRRELDRIGFLNRRVESWRDGVAEQTQSIERLWTERAVSQRLRVAFVNWRERLRSIVGACDDHGDPRRYDAGGRAEPTGVMCRAQLDLTSIDVRGRFVEIHCLALQNQRAHRRSAHRLWHFLRFDRRSRVEEATRSDDVGDIARQLHRR